jgi:glycosyltransferase involved in cell wall biosynthesis
VRSQAAASWRRLARRSTQKVPLVSIVVPFLNEERFIGEAVTSVFAQTYPAWELFLVDDGSTDKSTDYARRCAELYPDRVRYLDHTGHENRGLPASRNLALTRAKGDYVALLDADDVWLPYKLDEQVDIMKRHPSVALVSGRSRYWNSWTADPADLERDYELALGVPVDVVVNAPEMALLYYPLGKAPTPPPSDLLLSRSVLERIGGFEESFRAEYTMYEDQALLAKVHLEWPVYVADRLWDWYRMHPDSCISAVARSGRHEEIRRYFFEWLDHYLADRGITDGRVRRAIERERPPYEASPGLGSPGSVPG